jgi:hypothetical protein
MTLVGVIPTTILGEHADAHLDLNRYSPLTRQRGFATHLVGNRNPLAGVFSSYCPTTRAGVRIFPSQGRDTNADLRIALRQLPKSSQFAMTAPASDDEPAGFIPL